MRPLSVGRNLVANTKTTLFTVPTRQIAKWSLAHISNHTGSNKYVSLWWYDKSENTEVVIIDQYSLDARKILQFGGSGLFVTLEEGDEIRITSETGSAMSVTITVELEATSAVQYSQY
jgi:hypothetical protein